MDNSGMHILTPQDENDVCGCEVLYKYGIMDYSVGYYLTLHACIY